MDEWKEGGETKVGAGFCSGRGAGGGAEADQFAAGVERVLDELFAGLEGSDGMGADAATPSHEGGASAVDCAGGRVGAGRRLTRAQCTNVLEAVALTGGAVRRTASGEYVVATCPAHAVRSLTLKIKLSNPGRFVCAACGLEGGAHEFLEVVERSPVVLEFEI